MKHFLLIVMVTLAFLACKKEVLVINDLYLENVKKGLVDSLSAKDYRALDFSKSLRSAVDSVSLYLLRVPFKDKALFADFVVVRTTKEGAVLEGSIVHQQGKVTDYTDGTVKRKRWDGNITILSLTGQLKVTSPIVNGYITALHPNLNSRTSLVAPDHVLPEVIIISTVHKGGISWSSWTMVKSFFLNYNNGGGGGDSWGAYYVDMYDGSNSTGGGGGGRSTGGGPSNDPPILIDIENQDEDAEIDVQKFINCLNAIPDGGSTCSIEILADIPVDKDPNKIFNLRTSSPGHTFLNIRKQNGSQSVSQNIGFYPKSGLKTMLTNAPIDGKFVDNGEHEFNAGYKINITPEKLNAAIMEMLRTKNNKYDIDNYNCTDWAMDVFNAAGGNLQIPLYDIPGNVPSIGTRMPNGVYNKLKEMKAANHPQAANINIGIVKGYAGNSTGPCN